jgi:hypothetical protein
VIILNNYPPSTPSTPTGLNSMSVDQEECFTTSSHDPDEDQFYYLFELGDGSNSGWIGPYNSSLEVCFIYSWDSVGNYIIQVKAMDSHGATSDWSQNLNVNVLKGDPKLRFDNDYVDQNMSSNITVSDIGNNDIFPVTAEYNLEGTFIIDLYDNSVLIGSIWVFDSNSISANYQYNGDKINVALENGALIEKEGNSYSFNNPPLNVIDDDILSFNIVQLLTSSNPGSTIGSSSKINLISRGNGVTRSDTLKSAESLKLQVYSDNKEAWSQYYYNHDFVKEDVTINQDSVHSYEYPTNSSLILYHSCIEIDIVN